MNSRPRKDSSAKKRFASTTIFMASNKFLRASSNVAPCVFAPVCLPRKQDNLLALFEKQRLISFQLQDKQ